MNPTRCLLFLALLLALPISGFTAEDRPDAGGVVLDAGEGENGQPPRVERGSILRVSFPAAMVKPEAINLGNQPSPLVFTPTLEGAFFWKSETEGEFTVNAPVLPGEEYRIALASGLRDAAGGPVSPTGWGTRLSTEPFTAATDFEERPRLSGRPQVVVKFSYPVRLADAAEFLYFQDRDNAARLPAEIGLHEKDNESDAPEGTYLRVSPREPLPLGRTFDLILDGVREKASGRPLPFLRRFPLGQTAPLRVQWVGATNQPLEKPAVHVKFDDRVDPATAAAPGALTFEPPVPDLKVRASEDELIAEGGFDLKTHYRVLIGTGLRGARGYGLAAADRWGATFRPKPGAVFFPGPRIFQRGRLGLRFAFLQVHTGALNWRLSAVPMDKLPALERRLREFENARKDPFTGKDVLRPGTGFSEPQPTELLTDVFGLPTRARGEFPATNGEEETLRELNWQPPAGDAGPPLAGVYLLEIAGPAADGSGKTVGHRSLVVFSDAVVTQKRSAETVSARVAGMNDGLPRVGVRVRALSASNFELASGVTDRLGLVHFPAPQLRPPKGERGGEPARLLLAETADGPAVQFLDTGSLDEVYLNDEAAPPAAETLRGATLTDRPLYRPGHVVKIKGLVRLADRDGLRLRIPAGQPVHWTLARGSEDETITEGDTTVSADGGWEAEWTVPETARLGPYLLRCTVGGQAVDGALHDFRVEEYKVPPFEVQAAVVEKVVPPGKTPELRVRASYFSGQPVAGGRVKWRVLWNRNDSFANDGVILSDAFSEGHVPDPEDDPETRGEAILAADGAVTVRADPPPNLPGARYFANWQVAVTSGDGQTISAPEQISSRVMRQPALLGITAQATPAADGQQTLAINLQALDAEDHPLPAVPGESRVEVFRVSTKTVKEQVAPFVTRYRNTPLYTPVHVARAEAPLTLPVREPGRYVVIGQTPGLRRVSAEVLVDGAGADEVPVKTETSLEITPAAPEFTPGQNAAFLTRAPVSGIAWVSIESDRILDTLLVPLPGNTSRIEFPVKKEYAPNAHVAIYLLRPGGNDRLPAERFGSAELKVRRPDRELAVTPRFERGSVRPGEEVRGFVQVSSEGRPVAGAETLVYAVDDAVLKLGKWSAPELSLAFFPPRRHAVKTYAALRDFVSNVERKSLFQKGFVVGGGGEEFGQKFIRRNFEPLALWQSGLKSDAAGRVAFAFKAPDNLTRYRLIAVVQTRAGQFGLGDDTVEVAKPLMVEPSLPRFLRAGDELELRAVVRQSVRDTDPVSLTCTTDAAVQRLPGDGEAATVETTRNAPSAVRFRAKVADGPTSARVTFLAGSAADPQMNDAVEVTLPIYPPTILRRESTAGLLPPATPDFTALLPADAKRPGAAGRYDVAIATGPDLSRLRGLPAILEYPHGCFEQISSRVLAYTAMGNLLAFVPTDPAQTARYRKIVDAALRQYDSSLLADGSLPYWPGAKTGNPFVTIQAAWAAHLAAADPDGNFDVPKDLLDKLDGAVGKIVEGKQAAGDTGFLQAFALMVQATAAGEGGEFNAEAARALHANRETLGDEGRALLAIALHRANALPEEKRQLLREIAARAAAPPKERAFDPGTFASTNRTAAMTVFALAAAQPNFWKPAERNAARERLLALLDRAPTLSTQENLWSLFAFNALKASEKPVPLRPGRARPAPSRQAPNLTAAEWLANPLAGPGPRLDGLGSAAGALHYLISAEYRAASAEEDARRDRGLRVERVVRNLTDLARTGLPGAPAVRLDDRLLVTYRLQSAKRRDYVALEDELPAGLETVNPDMAMFAGLQPMPPPAPGERVLDLSSSELRDQKTQLYFDRLDPGVSTYSVLARANAAGTFRWPATQAGPMYEPTVSGMSPSGLIVIEAR